MKHCEYVINGKKYEVDILSHDGHCAEVRVNGATYKVEIPNSNPGKPTAPKRNNPGPSAELATGGRVLSPMPGTITKVLVEEGQAVKPGDPLMILEAMKMENMIHALREGSIKKIHVAQGAEVSSDSLLLEYD